MTRTLRKVCVYCASSKIADPAYRDQARELGGRLAQEGIEVVYGGGAVGSMGALADGALAEGGRVTGILPRFMEDLEWGHNGLTRLEIVNSMHERKHAMLAEADGVVALPGGCGTFEELLEAITWKRLGIFCEPIVLMNTKGFYDRLVGALELCVEERFMDQRHLGMWTVVPDAEGVIPALRNAPEWDDQARGFAVPGRGE